MVFKLIYNLVQLKELLRIQTVFICCMSQYTVNMSENSPRYRYVLKRIHHVTNNYATFPSFNLKAKQVSCLESLLLKIFSAICFFSPDLLNIFSCNRPLSLLQRRQTSPNSRI